jgi:hypothetical protein
VEYLRRRYPVVKFTSEALADPNGSLVNQGKAMVADEIEAIIKKESK